MDGIENSDPHVIADTFNEYFAMICEKTRAKLLWSSGLSEWIIKVTEVCGYIPLTKLKSSMSSVFWIESAFVAFML